MQFKQGQNREQMFMASMSEWVAEDSWARIADRLRQQVIEPIFGIFRRQWDLDYMLLLSSENVITEYRIAGLTFNLMRLVSDKGLNWVKLRLKKLLFLAHRAPTEHYNLISPR